MGSRWSDASGWTSFASTRGASLFRPARRAARTASSAESLPTPDQGDAEPVCCSRSSRAPGCADAERIVPACLIKKVEHILRRSRDHEPVVGKIAPPE